MTVTISGTPDTRLTAVPDTVSGVKADVAEQMGRIYALFLSFPDEDESYGNICYFWSILDGFEDNMPGYIPPPAP